jgi:ribosome maturation factor RimP
LFDILVGIMEYPDSLAPVAGELDNLMDREHLHLIDAKIGTGSRFPLIRLLIDREDRFITIDDCADISRLVGDILDKADCFPRGYRLEVSSPGMSHPLREPWEFRKHLERRIRISYHDNDQIKEREGYLLEIGAKALVIRDNESEVSIDFDRIIQAFSVIDWQRPPTKRAG